MPEQAGELRDDFERGLNVFVDTGLLDIIAPLDLEKQSSRWTRTPKLSLLALVCTCSLILTARHLTKTGMGGLATALALAKKGFTSIDLYETASNLGFVGAGIQLAPNMARILDNLGAWKRIEKEAVELKETSIRREF